MKRKLLTTAILLTLTATAQADNYIALKAGGSTQHINQATFTPTHPISTVYTGYTTDKDTAGGIAFGFRSSGGLMAEVGYAKFGTFNRLSNFGGADAMYSYHTTTQRTEETSAFTAVGGKRFVFFNGAGGAQFGLSIQGGLHHYTKDVLEKLETYKTKTGSFATTVTTVQQPSTETGNGGVVSANFDFHTGGRVEVFLGTSYYSKIKLNTVDAGLRILF